MLMKKCQQPPPMDSCSKKIFQNLEQLLLIITCLLYFQKHPELHSKKVSMDLIVTTAIFGH